VARRESNPNFRPFGSAGFTLAGMTAKEQAELGPHERIQAVWPLLLKLCSGHVQRLEKLGIRVVMDDLLQEIAATLLERDDKWDWQKGRYTTFVNIVWRNVRQRLDETRGVVPAPHNAWATMQKLRKAQEAGGLSGAKQKTLRSLEIVHHDQMALKEPR
jgi:hypothetical protein